MSNQIFSNLNAIVAVSDNNVLGLEYPPYMHWVRKIPRDMKNFTEVSTGKNNQDQNGVIMGMKTWNSLPDKFKPLTNRQNIILSRSSIIQTENTECFSDIDSVLRLVQNQTHRQFWVMGGNQIYSQFFPHIGGELHITRIHENFDTPEGNQIVICIPEFRFENTSMLFEKFHKIKNESHDTDEKNHYPMTFEVYKRKSFPVSDFNYTC